MGIAMHVISTEPVMLHGYDWQCGISPFGELGPALEHRPATFFLSLSWTLLVKPRIEGLARAWNEYRRCYPQHKIIILANMPEEKSLLDSLNIPAVLCPHNALLDEQKYAPLPLQKKWTAVINARIARFKRIELAKDVPSTCLITYKPPQHNDQYEAELQACMPHMDWLQYENGQYTHYYSEKQVQEVYAQSHCGLILSEVEGGCFASTEYLLCGLPVVSTANVGGRDLFFHPDYVFTAEPHSLGVLQAVARAASCPITPEEIRHRTIGIMQRHRQSYIATLNREARRMGYAKDFAQDWQRFYTNKMLRWYPDDKAAINDLANHGLCQAIS